MRRPVAASASILLHAGVIAGAALIVFPIKLDKAHQRGIQLELVELAGPDANQPAARPAPVTQSVAPGLPGPDQPASFPPEPQPSPVLVAQPPALPAAAIEAPPTLQRPLPQPALVPQPATAIARLAQPMPAPSLQQILHQALQPDEVPAIEPAVHNAPAPQGLAAPAPPQPAQLTSTSPLATASTSQSTAAATPRLDRDALGEELRKGSGRPAGRGIDRASLGKALSGQKPTGAKRLTARQRVDLSTMIRKQITPCWNPPAMSENPGIVTVTLRIKLKPSGQVDGTPGVRAVSGGTSNNQAYVTAFIGSVRRAVLRCAPLQLPADLYDAWSDVELNFDPRDVL